MAKSDDDAADARFEDGFKPVKLIARDAEDLKVISALLQDAVIPAAELAYDKSARRFAFMANRFRWEAPELKERVRAAAHVDNVLSARSRGVLKPSAEPSETETDAKPLALLAISFEPDAEPPSGLLRLACSGGAEIELRVEALEIVVADRSKPWPAAATPAHFGG